MGKKLIIKGADFSVNGFTDFGYNWLLQLGLSLNATATGRAANIDQQSRAVVLVPRSECINPVTWNDTMEGLENYSTADVLPGMSKITVSVPSGNYYYVLVLKDENGNNLISTNYRNPGSSFSVDLTQYPNAKRFYVTFKIGQAGTEHFTNETLESIGARIVIE